MKNNLLKTLIIISLIFSCTTDDEAEQNNPDLPFSSTFQKRYPNGNLYPNGSGSFDSFSINNSGTIRLSNTDNTQVDWVEFKNITINNTGTYNLLYTPYARAQFEAIYSTAVDPVFWTSQGGNVDQGGTLNITSYNNGYISGNYYFVAWYFSTTLNREVGWAISGEFENLLLNN